VQPPSPKPRAPAAPVAGGTHTARAGHDGHGLEGDEESWESVEDAWVEGTPSPGNAAAHDPLSFDPFPSSPPPPMPGTGPRISQLPPPLPQAAPTPGRISQPPPLPLATGRLTPSRPPPLPPSAPPPAMAPGPAAPLGSPPLGAPTPTAARPAPPALAARAAELPPTPPAPPLSFPAPRAKLTFREEAAAFAKRLDRAKPLAVSPADSSAPALGVAPGTPPRPRQPPPWLRDETMGFPPPVRAGIRQPAALQVSPPLIDPHEPRVARRGASAPDRAGEMFEALACDEYATALGLAEAILADEPDNEDALQCAAMCRSELEPVSEGPAPSTRSEPPVLKPPVVEPPPEDEPQLEEVPPSIEPPRARAPSVDPAQPEQVNRMFERLASGNYPAALMLAEALLDIDPENADAEQCASMCRSEMRKLYAARLGSLEHVPRHLMTPEALQRENLDHLAGFLLSRIDGEMSIDELLDSTGMPALDVLRCLYDLQLQGVIEVDPPA
jgi:hypothetical protein